MAAGKPRFCSTFNQMTYKIFTSPQSKKKFFIALTVILFIFLTLYYFLPVRHLLENPDKVRKFVLGFGVSAPLIFILLQILQVLIAPVPGQTGGLLGGYLFGAVKGTIYTTIGIILGTSIAIALSRRFGRPFVKKIIDKDTLKRFDGLSEEKGTFTLFLIYLLPALPDDTVSFIAGLTEIPIRKLIFISFVGRLPGLLVLNMVGSGIAEARAASSIILLSILAIVSFLIYIYRKKLESISVRIVKKYQNLRSKSKKI